MKKSAYKVDSPDEEGSEIVFATSEKQAQDLGGQALGGWYCAEEYNVALAPEFDQWEPLGFVPMRGLLAEGWWVYSAHHQYRLMEGCTKEQFEAYRKQALEEDWDFEEDNSLYIESNLVESKDRRSLYRDMDEVEEHAYFIKEFKDSFEQFKKYVAEKYPQFNIVEWKGDYPSYTKIAKYNFPGSKYEHNEIRWDNHEDPLDEDHVGVYVCQGDQEAFNVWRETWQK